jgi:hypothetical protein
MSENRLPTVSAENVEAQKNDANSHSTTKNVYDKRRYLNTVLAANETSRKVTIRLLPFDSSCKEIFHKVHQHIVRVDRAVSKSGWQTYICPSKNSEIEGDNKCPFCETAKEAYSQRDKAAKETAEYKTLSDIGSNNLAKEAWIVRCIDRSDESIVKWWKFSSSKKGNGIYDAMMARYKARADEAKEDGQEFNIFDVNEGCDLELTITKNSEGKQVIQVDAKTKVTPLSNDFEKALGWINDPTPWTQLWGVKPYDYLSVIVQGGVPVFDKEKKTYVSKEEAQASNQAAVNANLTEAHALTPPTEVAAESSNGDDELPF